MLFGACTLFLGTLPLAAAQSAIFQILFRCASNNTVVIQSMYVHMRYEVVVQSIDNSCVTKVLYYLCMRTLQYACAHGMSTVRLKR